MNLSDTGEPSRTKKRKVTFAEEVKDVDATSTEAKPVDKKQKIFRSPEQAAAERAALRREVDALQDGLLEADNLEDAEEAYEIPTELYNDQGIPFEPFHLKRERESGYFDADGNYVEYRSAEVKDAWLDSLPLPGENAAVQDAEEEGEEGVDNDPAPGEALEELDAEDLLAYRKRIVELLLPGESVLQALRRLGQPDGSASEGQQGPEPAGSSGRADEGPKQKRTTRGPVPANNREAFDKLTEWSSLLLQHGDYDIHSDSRERIAAGIQRQERRAAEELLKALPGLGTDILLPPQPASGAGLPGIVAAASDAADAEAPGARAAGSPGTSPSAAAGGVADPEEDLFGDTQAQDDSIELPDVPRPVQQAPDGTSDLPCSDAQRGEAAGAHANVLDAGAVSVAVSGWAEDSAATALQSPDRPGCGADSRLEGAEAAPVQSEGGADAQSEEFEGFTFDAPSGLWYNSDLGCIYDATHQLYGDANSGAWYTFRDGQYQLVS